MLKKTCLSGILCLLLAAQSLSQEAAQLQDHKPLLGEIHYGNRVGGIQAQEGASVQLIAIEETDILKSVQVYLSSKDIVGGFQLELERNKKIVKCSFGNIDGSPQKKFIVENDKKLVGIRGASGWYIDNIQFVFDDGSTTPRYGAQGGDLDFSLVLNRNAEGKLRGRLMGFWGSSTNLLETIGLVFWPIE